MAERTNISWTDHTHNHWIGCSKVSPACDGCYAEAMMDMRYGRVQWGGPGKGAGTRALTSEANRKKPLAWNRRAEREGARPFVFCSSLADVFDNQVPPEWRYDLFDLIRKTPRLVWLLLSKRPQNIVRMVEEAGGMSPNIAFGATCEDQTRYDLNAKHLAYAQSALRPEFTFLSCEPLLGPIYLHLVAGDPLNPAWIITGGETDQGGHKARPTHPDWFRSLRDQAAAIGAAYHHKQHGEWAPGAWEIDGDGHLIFRDTNDRLFAYEHRDTGHWWTDDAPEGLGSLRVGKKRAGRLLDGVEHNGFPAKAVQ